jgi:hypothetical protein
MRWMLLAASAIVAAGLWLPLEAAEPAPSSAGEDAITFEQYRDWRMHFIERRQTQLAMQLSTADLPARQKTRLEQVKAYYVGSPASRKRIAIAGSANGSTRSTPITTARSTPPSAPRGGRNSASSIAATRMPGASPPNPSRRRIDAQQHCRRLQILRMFQA